MPFTYSITNGIGAGFIAFTFLKIASGVARCSGFCGVILPSDCLAGVSAKQFAPVCVNKPN